MKAVFLSDVHLKRDDHRKVEFVKAFIRDVCADAQVVVIMGDLFEFYHGYDGYIFPWFQGVADALKDAADKGTRVYVIEGNHEFGMGTYFTSYTGASCARELTLHLDGRKIFMSHGDEIEALLLAKILRSRVSYRIMDFLSPAITWRVASIAGLFLSKKKKEYSGRALRSFREYALKKFGEGYDVVLLGHSHMSDRVDFSDAGGVKVYLNTGDFGDDGAYVEYETNEGFSLKTYVR